MSQEEANEWDSGPIGVVLATSLTNDEPRYLNLTETIGHGKRVPSQKKRSDANCYFLQQEYNRNDEEFRRKEIYPFFVIACREAGFRVTGNYEKSGGVIYFECLRAKFGRSVKNGDDQPNNKKQPVKGDNDNGTLCKFRFSVYWDEDKERWFLPHLQSGCIRHCGHLHINPSDDNHDDDNNMLINDQDNAEEINYRMYEDVCNLASAKGEAGRKILCHGLNSIRAKLMSIGGPQPSISGQTPDDEIDAIIESRRRKQDWPVKHSTLSCFSNHEDLVKVRFHHSEKYEHIPIRIPKSDKTKEGTKPCKLCSTGKIRRKTTWMCATCKVPLCTRPLIGEDGSALTHHTLWHTARDLMAEHERCHEEMKNGRQSRKREREEDDVEENNDGTGDGDEMAETGKTGEFVGEYNFLREE
eukprot:CAMPEP_0172311470 /NCGR_PEP_ID=MMETSP1058-20130122/14750_1 /TAXON_ID=83371 /ORGANISM="Detonula confervacea, Strain CCMP 353" /LENGTH=412 /DNA_ID=CAMNT_0013024643 /DNA_START=74 /DNA_END=1312 /DNA_ORIENTATION=+